MGAKLEAEQIAARLVGLPGWALEEDKWIRKRFRFPSYMDGIAFVHEVARLSEDMNHHPMIAIEYKLVTLRLTSWHAGGLTELDFAAAAAYDRVFGGDGGA